MGDLSGERFHLLRFPFPYDRSSVSAPSRHPTRAKTKHFFSPVRKTAKHLNAEARLILGHEPTAVLGCVFQLEKLDEATLLCTRQGRPEGFPETFRVRAVIPLVRRAKVASRERFAVGDGRADRIRDDRIAAADPAPTAHTRPPQPPDNRGPAGDAGSPPDRRRAVWDPFGPSDTLRLDGQHALKAAGRQPPDFPRFSPQGLPPGVVRIDEPLEIIAAHDNRRDADTLTRREIHQPIAQTRLRPGDMSRIGHHDGEIEITVEAVIAPGEAAVEPNGADAVPKRLNRGLNAPHQIIEPLPLGLEQPRE